MYRRKTYKKSRFDITIENPTKQNFDFIGWKVNGSDEIIKDYVIKVIGKSNICSEYILYTPILRRIKNDCQNVYECMIKILTDDDSIAYSLLLSLGVDIEAFYLSIVKNEIELI